MCQAPPDGGCSPVSGVHFSTLGGAAREDGQGGFLAGFSQSLYEILPIRVVQEGGLVLAATARHVIDGARIFDAQGGIRPGQ